MKIKNLQSFGIAVRDRRKKLNYTQLQISEFTGLSARFISDVEHGKETVEFGKVLKLINVLGMDIELLARIEK